MRVESELTFRRLVVALLVVLLVPGLLIAAALSYDRPAPPPAETASEYAPLPQTPDRVATAQFDRSRVAVRLAGDGFGAVLLQPSVIAAATRDRTAPGTGAMPTLVLSARPRPYVLSALYPQVPQVFDLADGVLLVKAHIEVAPGATLVIDSSVDDVRLASSSADFATLISRGVIDIRGGEEQPVRISSWDPSRGAPDTDVTDGRPFIVQVGNRMDVDRAQFEYLGFGTGTSSGVAWRGTAPDTDDGPPDAMARSAAVSGTVTSSVFAHNYFGAYTHVAEGMRWSGNTFRDNVLYGFDPHDFSNNFVVEGNVAHHNGKHGFIFSRGCVGNVLRGNYSHDNVGHGFMIDDGRSTATTEAEVRVDPSDDNQVVDNVAARNAGSGVEIEGGTGNVVAGNRLTGHYVGVRVKNGAAVVVSGNEIEDSVRFGIDVLDTDGAIPVTGNRISGAWGAVNLSTADSAVLADNVSTGVSAPLVVGGLAARDSSLIDRVGRFLTWNPLLVLWGLVLGVPLLVAAVRPGVGAVLRRRRVPA